MVCTTQLKTASDKDFIFIFPVKMKIKNLTDQDDRNGERWEGGDYGDKIKKGIFRYCPGWIKNIIRGAPTRFKKLTLVNKMNDGFDVMRQIYWTHLLEPALKRFSSMFKVLSRFIVMPTELGLFYPFQKKRG